MGKTPQHFFNRRDNHKYFKVRAHKPMTILYFQCFEAKGRGAQRVYLARQAQQAAPHLLAARQVYSQAK